MADSEHLSDSDVSDEGEWADVAGQEEDEGETMEVISLLDDRVFPGAVQMIEYCKDTYKLDFLAIRDRLNLDFYGTIKLINFIRHRVHEGVALPEQITLEDIQDDRFLKPVLDDDALILCLDDLPGPKDEAKAAGTQQAQAELGSAELVDSLLQKNADLQAELDQLAKQFNNYRLAVQQTLDQRWGTDDDAAGGPSGKGDKAADGADAKGGDDSEYYFESYAHNEIHETMLKDTVRTDAYRDFIYQNKQLFAGKVVLDVGCGTGILSMFCAKAGAKQVIAVDRSDIIDKARENIFTNGLDKTIMCLKGKVEEVVLPVNEVDIIVSEWMGYCLLYEAMLPSVIWARDKYLKPDGLLVPSHASMWLAPVSDAEYVGENINFWRDVYGFDFTAMQRDIHVDARIQHMPTAAVCGSPFPFRWLDLHTTKVEELVFEAPWRSVLTEKIDHLHGFLVWFDIFFAQTREDVTVSAEVTAQDWAAGHEDRVAFTTGPYGKETHWRQGLLLSKGQEEEIDLGEGNALGGEITYAIPDGKARGVNLTVTWSSDGKKKQSQTWLLH